MKYSLFLAAVAFASLLSVPSLAKAETRQDNSSEVCGEFTVAVIPDTQYYNDYKRQKASGYPIDAHDIFLGQMRYIADHSIGSRGNIVFATHVGDVWENPPFTMNAAHAIRGFESSNPTAPFMRPNAAKTWEVEVKNAVDGFRLIDGKIPFAVAGGNHDMDAAWMDSNHPREADGSGGIILFGGNSVFNSAFSARSEFFKDKPWYVGSHDGGIDSAQVFTAGQCRFLHIALQWDAPNGSLAWASELLKRFPGVPTIVTTHKFIDGQGNFVVPGDSSDEGTGSSAVDPEANNPRMIWDKFVREHDQIFMVLSGHRPQGGGYRFEKNRFGHEVHMIMSDYQLRGQIAKEIGVVGNLALGDGWLRLMTFDLDADNPTVQVRTYSSYYGKFSTELKEYASWYKADEAKSVGQQNMADDEFLKRDDFVLVLKDFHARFPGFRRVSDVVRQ